MLYTNFGAEDLRPEIRVFKGAESDYGISFVSSHQVYELRHMWVLVKILTVDQFNNIEENESSINKSVLKVNGKRFSFKILLNRIELKKPQQNMLISLEIIRTCLKMLILMVRIGKLH